MIENQLCNNKNNYVINNDTVSYNDSFAQILNIEQQIGQNQFSYAMNFNQVNKLCDSEIHLQLM